MTLLQNEQYYFVFGKTKKRNGVMITLQRAEKTNVIAASVKLNMEDAQIPLKLKVNGNILRLLLRCGQWLMANSCSRSRCNQS